jgi:hypothetical protein
MPIAPVRQIVLATAVLASLAACSSVGRYDAAPSKSIDLSGNWVINRTLSDDPKPVLQSLRPKPAPRRWDQPPPDENGDDTGPPRGGQQGGGGGGGGRSRRGGSQGPQVVYRNNNEAYTHSAVLKVLTADLSRADNMTIQQSPERFSIDYGSAVRSFTPGSVSVVSAAWGVADQGSGWSGKSFVIKVKPQTGVASEESYSLEDDGQHLVEVLRLGGGEFPAVKLKRVYDRTDHPVQRAVPMTD